MVKPNFRRANLSNDYFTNRQDRYHLFSSKDITDYFFRLHETISRLSFLVSPNPHSQSGYRLEWPASNLAPSPLISLSQYISESSKALKQMQVPRQNLKFAELNRGNFIIIIIIIIITIIISISHFKLDT